MPAIGITGGIATGKTTFCELLGNLLPCAAFFNADRAARLLTDENLEVQQEIRAAFGAEICPEGGHLNRNALRAIILESTAKRTALEQILHPRIRRQWSAEAQRYRNSPDFFFADIPLLYETGGELLCDRVVVVACSPDVQLRRLVTRGRRARISEDEARLMINAQMSIDEKVGRADHVVWNNDGEEVLTDQAADLVKLWQVTWTKR